MNTNSTPAQSITLTQVQMRVAVEYWLNNQVFKKSVSVKDVSIHMNTSFEIKLEPPTPDLADCP